jgi:hypothetical protein
MSPIRAGGSGYVLEHLLAGEVAHADDPLGPAQREPFEKRERPPHLDPVRDQRVAQARIPEAGRPEHRELCNMAAEGPVAVAAHPKCLADKAPLAAGAHAPGGQAFDATTARVVGIEHLVVQGKELDLSPLGTLDRAKRPQVQLQHPRDPAH